MEIKRFNKISIPKFIIYFFLLLLVISSFKGTEISFLNFKEGIPYMIEFLKEMFPPNLYKEFLYSVFTALILTFKMALAGTIIGVVISLPLAILASKKLTPIGFLYHPTRLLISLFRTVPDLIWALFFVATIGLGPFAGVLALTVDTIGFCGRFFAESFEETAKEPVQGLKAIGANKLAIIFCAVIPGSLPSLINSSLFSLEKAVRSSVVLGLVGAGGIGVELKNSMDMFEYSSAATIIILIFILVIFVEQISSYIRNKIID